MSEDLNSKIAGIILADRVSEILEKMTKTIPENVSERVWKEVGERLIHEIRDDYSTRSIVERVIEQFAREQLEKRKEEIARLIAEKLDKDLSPDRIHGILENAMASPKREIVSNAIREWAQRMVTRG